MELAISNIAWKAEWDESVYALMKKYGFSGLEIAPTRWIVEKPYERINEAVKINKKNISDYRLPAVSMQSIWYGRQENIWHSEEERKVLTEYTKKAIDYASALGISNMVFGSPKNRNMPVKSDYNIAVNFFRELGEYAYKRGTVLAMEANSTIYGTNYINTTEQAVELIKCVDSRGFKLNLDFGMIIANNEEIGIVENYMDVINHVHISEPMLKIIEKRDGHRELAEVLRKNTYSKYISIEMGNQENFNCLKDTMEYIREVFG